MIVGCGGQVRAGAFAAYALDFGAVLALGAALGADLETLAELLPDIEPAVLRAWQKED